MEYLNENYLLESSNFFFMKFMDETGEGSVFDKIAL